MRGLIVDNFAGGGGASLGIEQATWGGVDVAINHDPVALAVHAANHPHTEHRIEDVFASDPRDIARGRPIALVWLSPDCKHHSKAKGGKPRDKNIRALAWVTLRWAALPRPMKPAVIALENVEEFQHWGPLKADGQPCPLQKGRTFNLFLHRLRQAGYAVEWRELRACDFGAPTIRKRLFMLARCDGRPIRWPEPTHGAPGSPGVASGRLKPWRSAAECIDWSIPCRSIFGRDKPLAEKTMARIARGVRRFVQDSPFPFVVPMTHGGRADLRCYAIQDPLRTVTGANRGEHALVTPFITKFNRGATGHALTEPLHTITAAHSDTRAGAAAPLGVVAAFMAQHNTDMVGHPMVAPVSTIVGKGSTQGLVSAFLTKFYGTSTGSDVRVPFPTITAGGWHVAEVRAFLLKYYGEGGQLATCVDPMHTVPTRDRLGLVTVAGTDYQIVDIGMRMLTPRELFRAQGFPDSYVIDKDAFGNAISKTHQVRLCGNSVCPPVARAILEANFVNEIALVGAKPRSRGRTPAKVGALNHEALAV